MNHRFGFDPRLPTLPSVFELGAVAQLFEERWSHLVPTTQPPVTITGCRLQDTKYQPATRCVTTYELRVQGADGLPWSTIGVIETTPAGSTPRLFDQDAALPWLATATDPDAMCTLFRQALEGDGAPAISACNVIPVRYRPGVRCVLRYELATSAGRRVVFGKLLGEGSGELAAILETLSRASIMSPGMPRVLPPLAYWPELHLLAQPAVIGGAELNTVAFDEREEQARRDRWLRDAGKRLAALHDCCGVHAPHRSFDDDLRELHEYRAPIAQIAPALGTRYEQTLGQVEAWPPRLASTDPVTSHGAFRTDQFLIEHDTLVMIDLDGVCHADAARDLGNFMAYLSWKAIRRPEQATSIERVGRLFLEGYAAARPGIDQAWLTLYHAASLLKIAGRRFRSLSFKEWDLAPRLLDLALAVIETQKPYLSGRD